MPTRGSAIGRLPELAAPASDLQSRRRRGIGRALVAARLADVTERRRYNRRLGASPDGWRLRQALKFRGVPVVPAPASTYQSDGLGSAL
jgi:hypothetical protein